MLAQLLLPCYSESFSAAAINLHIIQHCTSAVFCEVKPGLGLSIKQAAALYNLRIGISRHVHPKASLWSFSGAQQMGQRGRSVGNYYHQQKYLTVQPEWCRTRGLTQGRWLRLAISLKE